VKLHKLLDSARTPDGDLLTLARDGEALTIRIQGRTLMSSHAHGSEEDLALHGCSAIVERKRRRASVLVGGLGLGYTLRAALDVLPADASLVCVELLSPVVRWHREGPLGEVAGRPLDDPRVVLLLDDVRRVIASSSSEAAFDAILLDVDNGPTPISSRANASLYDERGLRASLRALAPGGTLAVWSAFDDKPFAARMRAIGLETRVVETGARKRTQKDWKHWIFLGRRSH